MLPGDGIGGDAIVEPDADAPIAIAKPIAAKAKAAKAKAKEKAKALAKVAAADSIDHLKCAFDFRGDGSISTFRYDTKRKKLAAHCGYKHHGPLCRIGRGIDDRAMMPAGLFLGYSKATS